MPHQRGISFGLASLLALCLCGSSSANDPPASKPAPHPLALRVIDANTSDPVEGVRVSVETEPEGDKRETDASGKCELTLRPEQQYVEIRFEHAGYVPIELTFAWYPNPGVANGHTENDLPKEFEVKLPPGRELAGRVVDEATNPVMGAYPLFSFDSTPMDKSDWPQIRMGSPPTRLATGADGGWQIDCAPQDLSKVTVTIVHDDFISVAKPGNEAQDIMLHAGIRLTGKVTGPKGEAITGAEIDAQNEQYYVISDRNPSNESDDEGNYRLAALAEGKHTFTVSAAGYSPKTITVDLKPGSIMDVALAVGHIIRGRVVDPAGKPIAQASLWCNNSAGGASYQLNANTNSDGKFELEDAPETPLNFQVNARNFTGMEISLKPDFDNVVTLKPLPVARGTVLDASTGKPIESFRVVEGFKQAQADSAPNWNAYHNGTTEFHGGQFEFPLSNQFTPDSSVHSLIRVEAEGYRTFVSDPLTPDTMNTLKFRLVPSPPTIGRVFNPDHSPAKDVTVRVVAAKGMVSLMPDSDRRDGLPQAKTDAAGDFKLQPVEDQFWLVASGENGWKFQPAAIDDFGKKDHPFEITLKPWTRLQGKWRIEESTPPPQYISVNVNSIPFRTDRSGPLISFNAKANIDGDGTYTADHIPDFDGNPVMIAINQSGQDQSGGIGWSIVVMLASGETKHLDLASAQGTTARGSVQVEGSSDLSVSYGTVSAVRVLDQPVANLPTEYVDAVKLAVPVYSARMAHDGHFTLPPMLAGEYDLTVSVNLTSRTFASGMAHLKVPANQQSIEIPTIVCKQNAIQLATTAPILGTTPPEVLGKRLDGSAIEAKSFQGKWVLLAVWNRSTDLASLQEKCKKFEHDDRVALIAVNADHALAALMGVPIRPRSLENPAWISGYADKKEFTDLSKAGMFRLGGVMIVSPAGKSAAANVADKDIQSTLDKLFNSTATQPTSQREK